MATFTNQATLSYNGSITNSNVTTGELLEILAATKTAITETYTAGSGIAYAITLVNSGTSPITELTLTDNLGAYTQGTETLYPLTFTEGTLSFFVNGVLQPTPTVTAGPPLTVSGINLPAGTSGVLLYEATANLYAPLAVGSSIINTVTVNGAETVEAITASATVPVQAQTSLTIAKAICPEVVTDNGQLTYTFIIQNSGNTPAQADANVIITDVFNPILNNISVTLNSAPFPQTSYTYNEATGEFVTAAGSITVPAATYTQAQNGEITVTPGVAVLKITGTV